MINQSKIDLIDPKTGEFTFLVVNHANGKKLIKAKDAMYYGICGLTAQRFRSWTESGVIETYAGNGTLRLNKFDVPFICLDELEHAQISIQSRKHDKVNVYKMRAAI